MSPSSVRLASSERIYYLQAQTRFTAHPCPSTQLPARYLSVGTLRTIKSYKQHLKCDMIERKLYGAANVVFNGAYSGKPLTFLKNKLKCKWHSLATEEVVYE